MKKLMMLSLLSALNKPFKRACKTPNKHDKTNTMSWRMKGYREGTVTVVTLASAS